MSVFGFLNKSTEELLEECDVRMVRGSGPGGQKADTTENTVQLSHPGTGITVSRGRTRSQDKNRELAVRELKIRFALETRHRLQLEDFSWPESLRQYAENGLRVKRSNPHFPFLVKITLDVLYTTGGRLSETGDVLGVSTNQLSRFFKDHDKLLERANRIREANDHHPIK